jgi:hypothetical protein
MPQSTQGQGSIQTAPRSYPQKRIRRARSERRIVLVLLAVFLALGLAGVFGPRTSTVTANGGGYRLTVTYPAVTRPGLPVRWEVLVTHAGGFPDRLRIGTTFDYFHLFDVTGIEPDATSSTSDGGNMVFEFDPPPGDTLRIQFDASVEPSVHELPSATTSVLVGDRPVVQVSYSTRVMP